MKKIPVDSSSLKLVGYDPLRNVLEVEFRNGGAYRYFDVPPEVCENLLGAASIGKYFNENIKTKFLYRNISPE